MFTPDDELKTQYIHIYIERERDKISKHILIFVLFCETYLEILLSDYLKNVSP